MDVGVGDAVEAGTAEEQADTAAATDRRYSKESRRASMEPLLVGRRIE
jgi:hypothetical protein